MNLPRSPKSGQSIAARDMARLIRHARIATPIGRGIQATANGSLFRPTAASVRKQAVAIREPFDVTLTPDGDDSLSASVWPGTVSGLLPANYAEPVSLLTSSTYFLTLHCTVVGNSLNGVTITAPTLLPDDTGTIENVLPDSIDIIFAIVHLGVLFQIRRGNLMAYPVERFRTEKEAPAPGGLPYNSWWGWEVRNA